MMSRRNAILLARIGATLNSQGLDYQPQFIGSQITHQQNNNDDGEDDQDVDDKNTSHQETNNNTVIEMSESLEEQLAQIKPPTEQEAELMYQQQENIRMQKREHYAQDTWLRKTMTYIQGMWRSIFYKKPKEKKNK